MERRQISKRQRSAPQEKPGEAWNTLQNLQASTQLTHAAHTHLGMGTHPLPGHTHTVYLSFPLCFPVQGSYSQMTSRLSGSANCTLFVDSGWFFHALKALLESPAILAHIGVRMVNLRLSLKLWGGWMWGGTQDNMKHLYFVIGNVLKMSTPQERSRHFELLRQKTNDNVDGCSHLLPDILKCT